MISEIDKNILGINKLANEYMKILERNRELNLKTLYHYASLPTLFEILESDSLWLSCSFFSNDTAEGQFFNKSIQNESFIFCVCDNGDLLSQWRGYCPNGGVSIGLDIGHKKTYSVLYADFDSTNNCHKIVNIAVPVLYYNTSSEKKRMFINKIKKLLANYNDVSWNDLTPFIKKDFFQEERERRLLFLNDKETLLNCIKFRRLSNGTKVPYIVIKYGSINNTHKEELTGLIEKLTTQKEYQRDIYIPMCSNQKEIFDLVKDNVKDTKPAVRVFCDGHLPIRNITISPMIDQDRVKKQVESFCQSRYWLKDIKVEVSEIPFVPSINS
jgi:hypothetical protein